MDNSQLATPTSSPLYSKHQAAMQDPPDTHGNPAKSSGQHSSYQRTYSPTEYHSQHRIPSSVEAAGLRDRYPPESHPNYSQGGLSRSSPHTSSSQHHQHHSSHSRMLPETSTSLHFQYGKGEHHPSTAQSQQSPAQASPGDPGHLPRDPGRRRDSVTNERPPPHQYQQPPPQHQRRTSAQYSSFPPGNTTYPIPHAAPSQVPQPTTHRRTTQNQNTSPVVGQNAIPPTAAIPPASAPAPPPVPTRAAVAPPAPRASTPPAQTEGFQRELDPLVLASADAALLPLKGLLENIWSVASHNIKQALAKMHQDYTKLATQERQKNAHLTRCLAGAEAQLRNSSGQVEGLRRENSEMKEAFGRVGTGTGKLVEEVATLRKEKERLEAETAALRKLQHENSHSLRAEDASEGVMKYMSSVVSEQVAKQVEARMSQILEGISEQKGLRVGEERRFADAVSPPKIFTERTEPQFFHRQSSERAPFRSPGLGQTSPSTTTDSSVRKLRLPDPGHSARQQMTPPFRRDPSSEILTNTPSIRRQSTLSQTPTQLSMDANEGLRGPSTEGDRNSQTIPSPSHLVDPFIRQAGDMGPDATILHSPPGDAHMPSPPPSDAEGSFARRMQPTHSPQQHTTTSWGSPLKRPRGEYEREQEGEQPQSSRSVRPRTDETSEIKREVKEEDRAKSIDVDESSRRNPSQRDRPSLSPKVETEMDIGMVVQHKKDNIPRQRINEREEGEVIDVDQLAETPPRSAGKQAAHPLPTRPLLPHLNPSNHNPPPVRRHQLKLGINHIDLLYSTEKDSMVCRMCITRTKGAAAEDRRKAHNKPGPVKRFPMDASWPDLINHCKAEHPTACEEMERLTPSAVAEMRQRMSGGSGFMR